MTTPLEALTAALHEAERYNASVEVAPEALLWCDANRDFVPLMQVLATVNRHTGWMEEFQHWQQRHHHGRPADRVLYAKKAGYKVGGGCKEASWASAYSTSCFNGFVPSALAQTMLRMTSGSPTPKDQRMPKCSAT